MKSQKSDCTRLSRAGSSPQQTVVGVAALPSLWGGLCLWGRQGAGCCSWPGGLGGEQCSGRETKSPRTIQSAV